MCGVSKNARGCWRGLVLIHRKELCVEFLFKFFLDNLHRINFSHLLFLFSYVFETNILSFVVSTCILDSFILHFKSCNPVTYLGACRHFLYKLCVECCTNVIRFSTSLSCMESMYHANFHSISILLLIVFFATQAENLKKKLPWLKYDQIKEEFQKLKEQEKEAQKRLHEAAAKSLSFEKPLE